MNTSALIFMGCSWGIVLALCVFCFVKLFSNQGKENK